MTRDEVVDMLARVGVDLDRLEPPSKVLLISAADLPADACPAVEPGLPWGVPLVVEVDGVPHRVQSSRLVPAGEVYSVDETLWRMP